MSYYDDHHLDRGPDLGYTNPKVAMVKKIKTIILGVLLLLMILLMWMQYDNGMAPYQDSHYKPIFPLEDILFALLLMALVMTIVGIAFKAFEIKVSETESQRFLLANGSMKASATTMIIAIVFAVLVFILPTADFSQDILNSEDSSHVNALEIEKYSFNAEDEFLIADITMVEMKVNNNVPVNVSLHRKWEYDENEPGKSLVPDSDTKTWGNQSSMGVTHYEYEKVDNMPYGKYLLITDNTNANQDADVTYTIHRKVKDSLFNMLLIFCILFAVLEGVWMGVSAGIRQKYRAASIYK
jgi:hypothetical protein